MKTDRNLPCETLKLVVFVVDVNDIDRYFVDEERQEESEVIKSHNLVHPLGLILIEGFFSVLVLSLYFLKLHAIWTNRLFKIFDNIDFIFFVFGRESLKIPAKLCNCYYLINILRNFQNNLEKIYMPIPRT